MERLATGGAPADLSTGDHHAGDPSTSDSNKGDPNKRDQHKGEPSAGEPNAGNSNQGRSNQGNSTAGGPTAGDRNRGKPTAPNPTAPNPNTGDPHTGDPNAGRLDTSTPNVARMYHHFLGGRETFKADRDAAEETLAALPEMRTSAAAAREFVGRTVRFLAAEAGIDQFLDLGVGLPAKHAVHEVARQVSPAARVAYVDFDRVVVSHGKALLAQPGVSVVVQGDLRRTGQLLAHPEIRAHLDFGRPIAVLLVSVLHFIADAEDPYAIVATVRDALAPGSYLVLSHATEDMVTDKTAARRAKAVYEKTNTRIWPRTRADVLRFFDGFDLVEPGLVTKPQWRPDPGADPAAVDYGWGGVGVLASAARE